MWQRVERHTVVSSAGGYGIRTPMYIINVKQAVAEEGRCGINKVLINI